MQRTLKLKQIIERVKRQPRRRKHETILRERSPDELLRAGIFDGLGEGLRTEPVAADGGEFFLGPRDGGAENAFGAGGEGAGVEEGDAVAVGGVGR
ncbi:hypothetical protein DID88_009785 [Monilinia fructigena]|uniref:Uncharacterized protein n=1 Tax=Monilinia fructigena TaxID=38457 RepID=A0A395IK03_9HELO|nr:hypothetical protein DID88_009785 [Monilinia fructigena]